MPPIPNLSTFRRAAEARGLIPLLCGHSPPTEGSRKCRASGIKCCPWDISGSETAQRHLWAHVSPHVVWRLWPWGPGPPEMGFQAVSQDLSPAVAANAQKQQATVPGAIRGAGGHGNSVTLARDQGPTGPRGHQSLGFLEGHLETAALARRAGLARALSSAPRPADPTGGSDWHSGRINSPWSSHAANAPLIRFRCLFFFAIGCGNANSVASYSVSRRLWENLRLWVGCPQPPPRPRLSGL